MVKVFQPPQTVPINSTVNTPLSLVILTAENPVNLGETIINVNNPFRTPFNLVVVYQNLPQNNYVTLTSLSPNNLKFSVKCSTPGTFFIAAVPISVTQLFISNSFLKTLPDHSLAIPITINSISNKSPSILERNKSLSKIIEQLSSASDSSNPLNSVYKKGKESNINKSSNISSNREKVNEELLRRNEMLSNYILSLAVNNRDQHFKGEFKYLELWLKNFTNQDEKTIKALDNYKEELDFNQGQINVWQRVVQDIPASGFSFNKSNSTSHNQAYNFRFISPHCFETISPLNLNVSDNFSVLGNCFNSVTNTFKVSSKFNWQRSTDLYVNQNSNYINQSSGSFYIGNVNSYTSTKEKTLQQTGSLKIQVDQNYDILAGQVNTQCSTNSILRTKGIIYNEAEKDSYLIANSYQVQTKEDISIKSNTDTNLYAQNTFYISAQGELSLASNSITRIQGSIIQIGMGSSARPIIDLDTNTILNPDPVRAAGIPTTSSSNQVQSAANS